MKIERTIDRESKLKLYVQIYTIIREKMENGEWPAGTQIPTEDDLCKTYDVSKVTVREAIQELVREGYLRRQQGKGTFVLYSVPHLGLSMRTRLTDVVQYGEGVTVRKEALEKKVIKPSEEIKAILSTEEDIHYVLSGKYADGKPYAIEELFFPIFTLLTVNDEDIRNKSFPDLIEEKGGKKISRVVQTFEVDVLKQAYALRLAMTEGSPALIVGRIFFSSDGSPVAYSKCILGKNVRVRIDFDKIK